jgi:8-oxo-dGTP pyrophosphatase MutT (NUDIX family)
MLLFNRMPISKHPLAQQLLLLRNAISQLDEHEDELPVFGDHFIDPSLTDRFQNEVHKGLTRNASVLIPLVIENGELTVLLTKRPNHFNVHPNLWCFPGGKRDGTDASDLATALRETFEEIGLTADAINTLGRLPKFWVCTDVDGKPGYNLSGFIGILKAPLALNLNADEVCDITRIPLSYFLKPRNARIINGEYSFTHGTTTVSGSTAALLVMLRDRLLGYPTLKLSSMLPTG